jgi:hypothetical protein
MTQFLLFLIINISNYLLLKIINNIYFENIQDKLNKILCANICIYDILYL